VRVSERGKRKSETKVEAPGQKTRPRLSLPSFMEREPAGTLRTPDAAPRSGLRPPCTPTALPFM